MRSILVTSNLHSVTAMPIIFDSNDHDKPYLNATPTVSLSRSHTMQMNTKIYKALAFPYLKYIEDVMWINRKYLFNATYGSHFKAFISGMNKYMECFLGEEECAARIRFAIGTYSILCNLKNV